MIASEGGTIPQLIVFTLAGSKEQVILIEQGIGYSCIFLQLNNKLHIEANILNMLNVSISGC